MKYNSINQLGDLNPQLLRELKGRLKPRNVLLAVAISLLGQFILFMYFQTQLPNHQSLVYNYASKYCTGRLQYGFHKCLGDEFGNVIINWPLWSLDVFILLSIIGCFTLLVGGTYLLISDLASEERRDTLNFIRLSPRSPQSILWGKMLGVPILLYLVALLAVPLHLSLGLTAKVPLSLILCCYVAAIAASFFYYSGALLFGLVGSWLGSFQSWLGSGAVLGFLLLAKQAFVSDAADNNPLVILKLISLQYLIPPFDASYSLASTNPQFNNFYWFSLPIGSNYLMTVGLTLVIYLIGAYFIWQSLQRCFRDSNTTILSKSQSYLLTTCFAVITIGFANWQKLELRDYYYRHTMAENLSCLMFLNFLLFLYLIAALNPNHQTLQDWARYRHFSHTKGLHHSTLIKDLIWGEKSPGILAIAINATIAVICLSLFVLVLPLNINDKINAFVALAFAGSLAVIYAALTQLILFMKNEHRLFWATGILGAIIILPPIILAMLFSYPGKNSMLWLFSVAAPLIALQPSGDYVSIMTPLLAILGHFGILGLLTFQLTRKLKKAGESATKALLVGS